MADTPTPSTPEDDALKLLLHYVRSQRGVDFTAYKPSSLKRRLEHRMQTLGCTNVTDYLDLIQAMPEELNALLDTLFINVTRFFRDKPAWDALAHTIIPQIIATGDADSSIRIWCAGVASGEEAFTIAMLMSEALGADAFRDRVKIFATDADDGALSQGRTAEYLPKQIEELPDQYRSYFDYVDGRAVFRADVRRNVIFGRHNLLEDAPISRLDLLICRNTLMYFNREAQSRILSRFHFALKDDAPLFLGKAETLLTRRQLFAPVDAKLRIFRKVSQFGIRGAFPSAAQLSMQTERQGLESTRIRHAAFESSPAAQFIIDDEGRLAFANQVARDVLGIESKNLGRPFAELEVSYRPIDIRSLLDKVREDRSVLTVPSVLVGTTDGRHQVFDVSVAPLPDGDETHGAFAVTFTDITGAYDLRGQLEVSKGELETAYEELQSTNEELETTNEELQSTVEELETTNEELQSTNEELETMNEELQSTNDEIRLINEQLNERGDEVDQLNAYLRSIVDSQQSAVVVVDADLMVSMWNRKAREMWGLREDEVRRQPVLNLDIGLPIERLKDSLRSVLREAVRTDTVVLPAHDRKGKAFDCRVAVSPLHGSGNKVTGLILTMEAAVAE